MTTSLKNPLSSVFHLISVSWTTLLSLLSSPRVTMHRRTDCTSLLNLELIWNVYNVNIDKIWPEIDLKYVDCSFPQSYSWAPKAWHQPSCHWRNKSNINNQNIPFLDKFFSPMLMQLSVSGPRWGRISCKNKFHVTEKFSCVDKIWQKFREGAGHVCTSHFPAQVSDQWVKIYRKVGDTVLLRLQQDNSGHSNCYCSDPVFYQRQKIPFFPTWMSWRAVCWTSGSGSSRCRARMSKMSTWEKLVVKLLSSLLLIFFVSSDRTC